MYLIICTVIIVWLFYEFYWRRRNLPPGPLPLPFIGNMHQFVWHQPGYKFTENCKKDYNPIYTMWMGTNPVVVFCDYDLIKETFVKDGNSYTDKLRFKGVNEVFRGGDYGIIEATGERWQEHRRFALHQMRDLGLGKMKMEERILIEIEELTSKLLEGGKIDIQKEMERAIANVINQMMFSYRFTGEKSEEFDHLVEMITKQQQSGGLVMFLLIMCEWTRKLPFFKGRWEGLMEFRDEFFCFFERQIEQHRQEIDYDSTDSTDYVEAYLKEQRNREDLGNFDSFSNIQLKNTVFDLWSAGLSTTAGTMNWAITYLLNYPDAQAKMQEEMDNVIGSSRCITMNDKPNLPYTTAVVNEVQRALNLVVTNIPHATTKDVEVAGYLLPKGTTVLADIGVLLYDTTLFPDPQRFDPERFLEDGKVKIYPEVMPFSLGKRACPGEGLARMELFLFTANIFNRFKLTSSNPPSLKKTFTNLQKPTEFIEFEAFYRY